MIFPRTDKYVGTSIQLYGEFSEGEAVLFKQVVLPGMRILEVGANIGALTLPLALIAGSEGEVHAFEPQRQLFYSLCGNLALNSITNVVAYNVGLGATSYVGKMPAINYGMVGNFGGASITVGDGKDPEVSVPVKTIDGYHFDKIDFMKVDVEGMEREVLIGGASTIQRDHPILYVENDRVEKREALEAYVREIGYTMWWHKPMLFNPDNWDRVPYDIFPRIASHNMLCLSGGKVPPDLGVTVVEDEEHMKTDLDVYPV